jgi:LCP family protein required for cell wall assembly
MYIPSNTKRIIMFSALGLMAVVILVITKPWIRSFEINKEVSDLLDERKHIVGILPILEKKEYITPPKEKNRLDILILGIRGDGEEEPEAGSYLTDTLMVLSIDKNTGETGLISIPRDLYVKMPYLNKKDKINAAYAYSSGSKDSGLAGVKTLVSQITGVYIDYAVLFDFEAFRGLVDTVGGVDVSLAVPFEEGLQWGSSSFYLPAGENHLDGEAALYYARSRFSTSDFDRSRRQQEIIFALKAKMISLGFLANPIKINNTFDTIKQHIRTDIQLWDIGDLAKVASAINKAGAGNINTFVIHSENLVYETKQNGIYILVPNENTFAGIREKFQAILQ